MSYPARVFRILVASPSDVTEEREIAVKTIQDWNDLNSAERQIVLLPLRWETHAAPEFGRRPQEVINRQVVEHADLLIGVFWTRIGTPTGLAESGTLEEIERVAKKGKPVMLYFSQAKLDPDKIDLPQLNKLREFKANTFPRALIETYTTQIDFRDKLARQLEIQIRSLLTTESDSASAQDIRPVADIQLAFADPESGVYAGERMAYATTLIEPEHLEEVPDFGSTKRKSKADSGLFFDSLGGENKEYYRELVQYIVRRNFFRPIRFWLKNAGGIGARDVYVDLQIGNEAGLVKAVSGFAILTPPKENRDYIIAWNSGASTADDPGELERVGSNWATSIEVQALQPQRELSPHPDILLGVQDSGLVTISARIYADTISSPIAKTLQIDWTVSKKRVRATELLAEAPRGLKKGAND